MNTSEIMKRLTKKNPAAYGLKNFKKDNLLDVINHYKNLQVIFVDDEENIIFLWANLNDKSRESFCIFHF